jgi:hypothetical protein
MQSASYIGKESNKLEEREIGFVHELDDALTEYGTRMDPWEDILGVLRRLPVRQLMSVSGLSKRAIQRIRNQGVRLHRRNRLRLAQIARRREALGEHMHQIGGHTVDEPRHKFRNANVGLHRSSGRVGDGQ